MFNIVKIKKNKRPAHYQAGMTYVELIVVLSIFAVMTSIVLFNYSDFQDKVDIKNLASDIASQIAQAQNAAMSGNLPALSFPPKWKPSYGVYLNPVSDNLSFTYFTDLNNDNLYEGSDCIGECLDKISITQGDSVSHLDVFYQGDTNAHSLTDLTLSFTRPNSGAILFSGGSKLLNVSYVQITISSLRSSTALIKIYPSGRIQIN